jgi:4-aminobutyrate aminotransferase-like enzyme
MSCAASDAVLGVVEEEGLMERATELGALLKGELEALQSPLIGDVRGIGLQIAVEIVADRDSKAIFPAEAQASERIGMLCREHGLLLFSRRTAGGANGEWLMVCPPLTTTREQIAELVGGLKAGLADFQREIEPGRVAVGA